MASAIDPTKPQDGVPAGKVDLRANLAAAKTELEHGGFAEGLTPSNYGPPANSQVKAHLAAIDAILPTLGGGGGSLTGWVDVVADHSATGDAVTDDTAAIQAALNSGAAVVYLPPGTYVVSSSLSVPPATMLVGAGPQQTIIDGRTVTQSDSAGILHCAGTLTSLPDLSSSIAEADGSIAFSSSVEASLSHGDWIRMEDTTANSMSAFGSRDGFFAMVHQAEGSTLYLANPVPRTLPAPRTSGALSNVESRKMDGRGIVLRDFTVWGQGFDAESEDSPINGIGIFLQDLANVYLSRVDVLGGASAALELYGCCHCRTDNCRLTVNQGEWNEAGAYAWWLRGSGHVTAVNCDVRSVRHAVDVSGGLLPSHDVNFIGGVISGPGTNLFQQPTSTSVTVLNWHEGSFATSVVGARIKGSVTLRGSDMSIEGCMIEGGGPASSNVGTISAWKIDNLNLRIVNNDIVVRNTHWKGSGCLFELSDNDLGVDDGLPGSLLFANNRIRIAIDTTQELFRIHDTTAKSPATSKIHILRNQVVQCDCSTTQPLLDLDVADMEELMVLDNILPANMSLGTPDSGSFDTYAARNVIGGGIEYAGLPTSSPGGTGRLWSDGGTLKLT